MCDSDDNWSDVEDELEEDQKCLCPFCDEVQPSVDDTFSHCSSKHALNLLQYKQTLCIDTYGWIKLINYVRKEHVTNEDLLDISSPPFPWDDLLYFQPVLPDDPLLQYDFDEDNTEKSNLAPFEVDSTPNQLMQRLKDMEQKVKESENKLQKAYEDMDKMRQAMSEILFDDKITDKRGDSSLENNEKDDEDGYFATYSHYSIHEEMLKDRVRMESYHLFISRNPELFKDKVVLDVGCGTGILSMMAVKSGASHVYAIDQSEIIYKAIEIARENNVSSKISFIRGRVEEVTLPVDKVDIIISEWMGYMLLFESMMDTVLYARDKWLKDCRHVYPNNCSISLAAMGDEYEYENTVKFWNSIEGFEMSCMKHEVLKEARVMIADEYSLISSADVLKKFDLSVVEPSELEFESHFLLTMLQTTNCHAIVVYFDIGFEVPTYRVYFSTSPQDTPTHWKQTVLFLEHPLKVQTGDMLRGVFKCCRDSVDHRSIIVNLSMKLSSFHKDDSEEPIVIEQSYMIC